MEKIFRTKSGFCHILADKIVLTRDGVIGVLSEVTVGNQIYRALFFYGLLSAGMLYFGYKAFESREILQAVFFAIIGFYLVYGIIKSLNNSATPVIDRNQIDSVQLKKGIKGLTRARFEVFFRN